jgi:putative endonuclease
MGRPDPDPSRAEERRQRLRLGHWAEWYAALALLLKGYRILALRYRGNGGEIDIIALRRNVVAFVEVKARRDWESALLAITATKTRRFARAVDHWRSRNPWSVDHTLRCDAVLVVPWRWPRHVADAFTLAQ